MSDLPNWIKAVDKSSEVTDEELKEINELTKKLKQAIREQNVKKIKELGKMSIQYFNDWGYFTLANEQINEIHDFTESLIDKIWLICKQLHKVSMLSYIYTP